MIHTAQHERFNALIEGVVVAIHYPGDPGNRSGFQVEYDVDPTSVPNMGRIRAVPRADAAAGYEDADENILRVASTSLLPGQAFNKDGGPTNGPTPRLDTDGDRVLVGFVNGNPHRPVIMGVLTHKLAKRKALPKSGALVRRSTHRGTEVLYDASGNVIVTFGPHPSLQSGVGSRKKLEVNIGDFKVKIDNTGLNTALDIATQDGRSLFRVTKDAIDLGEGGVAAVLGDQLVEFLNTLLDSFATHQHLVEAPGMPTVPLEPSVIAPVVADLKARLASGAILSDWIKLSKTR